MNYPTCHFCIFRSKNVRLIAIFIFVAFNTVQVSRATNYYFSAVGNDTNSGTSGDAAWHSLQKLDQVNLLPGDSVLMHRGDVFIGQIQLHTSGTDVNPIVISSYGEAAGQPILTGATSLHSWAVYPQNSKIYSSTILKPVKQLYLNNTLLDLARYPNAPNYLKAASGLTVGNVKQVSPTTLTQTNGYWVGATVKYRANNWAWEYRPITAFTNGNISYKPDTRYAVASGNSFFIENKKEQLDAPNEWFYDQATYQVLYYPTNAANIQTSNIKAVIYDNGIKLDSLVSYVKISNITFEKFSANGIYGVARNAFIVVDNCSFQNIEEIGVKFYRKANNCIVNNCFLTDIRGRGISFVEAYKNTISNNTVRRIGLFQGRGISGVNGYVGIVCEIRDESRDRVLDQYDSISNHNHVHHNTVDSTGYIGVRVDGQYNVVEKNIINRAMLTLDDGGGLYCYNVVTKSSKLANNFVMNSIAQGSISNGIYVDNKVFDMTVANNTVQNIPGAAVLINAEAHDNFVLDNVLVDNAHGISFSDWGSTAVSGNKVYRNTIISNSSSSLAININSNSNRYNVAVYDSNQYVNPYTDKIFQYQWSTNSTFNFATWRSYWPNSDTHSLVLTNQSTPKATAGTFYLFSNKTDNPRLVDLTGCGCTDLNNLALSQVEIPPFSSKVLIKPDASKCASLIHDPLFSTPAVALPTVGYDAGIFANDSVFGTNTALKPITIDAAYEFYPNPVKAGSVLSVRGFAENNSLKKIEIKDISGKVIYINNTLKKNEIVIPKVCSGIYFISVLRGNSKLTSKIRIVE